MPPYVVLFLNVNRGGTVMRKGQASLPLAFVLAMAADASIAPPSDLADSSQVMRAGVLAALAAPTLHKGVQSETGKYQEIRTRDRIAQFFPNFRNCFGGTWRNC